MTKRPGRPRRGALADLTIYPPAPTCIEPDGLRACQKIERKYTVALGQMMGVSRHYRYEKSVIVAFAAWQSVRVDGIWREVARIDSWHGVIHRHQFTVVGGNEITPLASIPANENHALAVIERWCTDAERVMQNEWQDYLRRWNGDGR